jgi:hypothetical protein
LTIVAIVKCANGYIALVEQEQRLVFNETNRPSVEWKPDTAHVFKEYADLVDWLYNLFEVSEEKIPA